MTRITSFRKHTLTFSVRDTGPEDGIPVVLLHGFPQTAESWAEVSRSLNESGHRTLAPDQRGYSPGAVPPRRSDYRLAELADDIVTLIERAGLGPVHLAGHDWGAAVAWTVAAIRPDLVRSLTAVSVPHPIAFLTSMLTSRQLIRSWYMLFFQLPWLPERLMRNDGGLFHRLLVRTGQQPGKAARDIVRLNQRKSATAALNWYRAFPYAWSLIGDLRRPIRVPTLQIWSDADTAVGREGHELSRRFVAAPWQLVTLAGTSHWIPDEAPRPLAELIARHAAGTRTDADHTSW